MDQNTSDALKQAALQASAASYSPYSGYPVGAAVLTESGKIYQGTNVENASYGATMCAERVAVFKAVSEGARRILAIAVYSNGKKLPIPCGMCLQVLSEFAEDIPVLVSSADDEKRFALSELLPHRFGEQ